MNFLEARRIVAQFAGGPDLPFLFALSGTPEPFALYLEAAAATRGRSARPRFLPFNTLHQHLSSGPATQPEVFLLLPWDLAPETDWRSGVPPSRIVVREVLERAERIAGQLANRDGARLLYLSSPIAPVVGHPAGDRGLQTSLASIALGAGASPVPAEAFSLGAYFSSGCPVGGAWLGRVADQVVDTLTAVAPASAKVLVTDLDNTVWSGVIAEDGLDGIKHGPEGIGYRFHLYQTMLARLRREGVVLAAVSRNDPKVVLPPLQQGRMHLGENDFVAICASYNAKSAQIRQLATQLNLGLDSFVFVDDNPVEREEVQQTLPQVRVLAFPDRDDGLPELFEQLSVLFGRKELTVEDRERTELYRRRLEGMAPAEAEGADLTRFLAGLAMQLTVHDRSAGDRTRAVQLINKTNQFNANGRRWTEPEVAAILEQGGRLFGASLADRSGGHGEIISCLIGADGTVEAFVMSCRVFQRQVEFAFLAALAGRGILPTAMRFVETERNEPFGKFTHDAAFTGERAGVLPFDARTFAANHHAVLDLFAVTWE